MTAGCHQDTWDSPSGKISRSAVGYAATWPEFAF
jgi:hypothetical protein